MEDVSDQDVPVVFGISEFTAQVTDLQSTKDTEQGSRRVGLEAFSNSHFSSTNQPFDYFGLLHIYRTSHKP